MSLDELVRLLNRTGRVRIRHLPGPLARLLLPFAGPKLPSALIDVMLRDSRTDRPTARDIFDLGLTSLLRVWGGGTT
jgi:hypothetical protein